MWPQVVNRLEHVGIRELKDHLSAYLGRVARGETILVTDRGRALARIEPASSALPGALAEALQEGRIVWSGQRPVLPRQVPAVRGPQTVADLVVEDRR